MKKRFFTLILATVMVAMLCCSLVACDVDTDEPVGITLSNEMSRDEIIEIIKKIENFTWEEYHDGKLYVTMRASSTYACATYESKKPANVYQFTEGNRVYEMRFSNSDDESKDSIVIEDYTGYDVTLSASSDHYQQMLNSILMMLFAFDDTQIIVEDGFLKIVESEDCICVLKNLNATKMPAIPKKYKDYKNMAKTQDVVVITYELSSDGTYYKVSDMSEYLNSYEIPEEYEGKPVKEFSTYCLSSNLTVTLPASIERITDDASYFGRNKGPINIIYKGTKAQWEAVENSIELTSETEHMKVTCSDGDFVVKTNK